MPIVRTPLSAVLACLLASCAAEPHPKSAALPQHAITAARAELTVEPVLIEVVGTVRAVRAATVAPLVSGTVAEMRVNLGSAVRAGDVLVRLSAPEIDARLAQARAGEVQSRRDSARAAALAAKGVIP